MSKMKYVVKVLKRAVRATTFDSSVVMTTHSPYVLTTLNLLLAATKAYEVDLNSTTQLVGEDYILSHNDISAYYINKKGELENLIDSETGLIMGEYLDSVSEEVDNTMYHLNEIIYGNDN